MSMVFYESDSFFRCWIKEMRVLHRNHERNFSVHSDAIAGLNAGYK